MSQSAVTDPATENCVGVREGAEAPACSKMRSSVSPSQPTCFTTPDSHSVTVSCTLAHCCSVCLALEHSPPALCPHYTPPTNKSEQSWVTLMGASCFHGMRNHKQSLCFLFHTHRSLKGYSSCLHIKWVWWINHSSEEENYFCAPFTSSLWNNGKDDSAFCIFRVSQSRWQREGEVIAGVTAHNISSSLWLSKYTQTNIHWLFTHSYR